MKRFLLSFAFIISFTTPFKSFGAIYILIDQFSPDRKFPIAIADFVNKKSGTADEVGVEVADILRRNMNLAGYFDIIPKSKYADRSAAMTPEEINFEQWTTTGARVFVKGLYKKSGKNLVLELRLYDPQLKQMLVGKEYKVKQDKAYAAIHRFADEIMLALTGEKGIFNTKIAAACGPQGKEQIIIMNVDGTERIELTDNNTLNLSPNWSPDGTELIYTSYEKFFPELYVRKIDVEKKKKKQGRHKRITFNNTMNITPAYSPDGLLIAFSSSMSGDPELYLIDPNGEKVGQITNLTGIDISPTWSPDGKLLAFSSERAGNLHIFVTDRNGSAPKRLTFTGYQNDTPEWSPRGDKIAFVKRAGGGFNIFLMNADGTQDQQLTTAGNNENPTFSPDGRYIVFSSSRKGGKNLFLMMWDGSNQTAISTDGTCKTPDWSGWFETEEKK